MSEATDSQYLALIPRENANEPDFRNVVTALVDPLVDAQNFATNLYAEFDVDTAIGVQLDVVGQWIGRSRVLEVPLLNIYFTLDEEFLGFDSGVWFGPFDTTDGVTVLDDATYRFLLYFYIQANNWDGSVQGLQAALDTLFPPASGTLAAVQDNMDMSITFFLAGELPSITFLALFISGILPLRPETVLANWYFVSINDTAAFGFDLDTNYIQGFDLGSWAIDNLLFYLPFMPSLDFSDARNSMYLPLI